MRDARLFAPAAILLAGCLLQVGVRPQHGAPLPGPLRAMPIALAGTEGREREMSDEERRAVAVTDYVFRTFGPDSQTAFTLGLGPSGDLVVSPPDGATEQGVKQLQPVGFGVEQVCP